MLSWLLILISFLLSGFLLIGFIKVLVEKPEFHAYALFFVVIFPYQYLINFEGSHVLTHLCLFFMFGVLLSSTLLGRKLLWDRVSLFYFFFLVFCLLNLLVGGLYVNESTWLSMLHVYIRLVEGFIIYFITFNVIRDEKHVQIVRRLSLVLVLLISGYFICENIYVLSQAQLDRFSERTIYQAFYTTRIEILRGELDVEGDIGGANLKRFWGWIGGPNGRAKFILILSSFALGFVCLKKPLLSQPLPVCVVLIGVMCLVLQMSLSAIGILFLVMLTYVYKFQHILFAQRTNLKKLALATILGMGLVFLNPFLLNKISVLFSSGGSGSHRVVLIGEAIDAAAKTGFLGNGFDSVARAKEWYEHYDLLSTYNTHNMYLEILLDSGLPGLLAFLAVLLFTFQNANWLEKYGDSQRIRQFGIATQFMLIAMVLNFFTSHGQLKNVAFFGMLWILMGCCNKLKLDQSVRQHSAIAYYKPSRHSSSSLEGNLNTV